MPEDPRPTGQFERILVRRLFASVGEPRPETWRHSVLETGLRVCLVLGAIVYVPSVWAAVRFDKWVVVVADTVALAVIALLNCGAFLSDTRRAVAFCTVMYVLGVALLIEVGPVCQIYLFGSALLATLLLGVRVGVFAVGLNAASLLAVGLAGHAAPEMAVSWHTEAAEGWVVTTMNFALVNVILVLAVGTVLAALERIARREREARDQLEQERQELVSANAALDRQMRERQELEGQLLHARKMEAVGQLAGGVAHDFNNLLTVINGYTDLLLSRPGADGTDREHLARVRNAGERAAGLTAQLLAFSRRSVLEPRVLDPNALVAETVALLDRLIGENVELSTDLDPVVRRVRVDPNQFGQVLMNLAVNGRDAMPTGGRLVITTRNAELDGSRPDVPPGRYVLTAVSDTGAGMTDEVKGRIFEPFFTTKGVGKGTGLGLATVFGIVKQSGGHVEVDSTPGTGTTFKVYLPATDESERDGAESGPVRGGTERVLLVEDQAEVRRLAARALRAFGYVVTEADGAHEALAATELVDLPPELLVTDVVMPGMSGRELADLLRPRFPGLRVLFVSGYTDDDVVRHGVLEAEVEFLPKPYTLQGLARKVREVLDRE